MNGPLLVAVSLGTPAQASTARGSVARGSLPADPGELPEAPGTERQGRTTAYFDAIATTAPADQATADLVSKLRSSGDPRR